MKTIKQYNWILVLAMVYLIPFPTWAGQVTIPNSFSAGTPASAVQVNGNFGAVTMAVNDNDARIAVLEQTIANLTAKVNNLQSELEAANTSIDDINNSGVMDLDSYVNVTNDTRGPLVTFIGVNLKLVNGTGTTAGEPNGLGNLIIGYDTERVNTTWSTPTFSCSDGSYSIQNTCESNGHIWAQSHKSGSHYLVVGDMHNYSKYSGIVAGYYNASTGEHASSVGGGFNNARSTGSGIFGGRNNVTRGFYSLVSGGYDNRAVGSYTSVSGGNGNTASGDSASVSGGEGNSASGNYASVSGGIYNFATHHGSSILGGFSQYSSSDTSTTPSLP